MQTLLGCEGVAMAGASDWTAFRLIFLALKEGKDIQHT